MTHFCLFFNLLLNSTVSLFFTVSSIVPVFSRSAIIISTVGWNSLICTTGQFFFAVLILSSHSFLVLPQCHCQRHGTIWSSNYLCIWKQIMETFLRYLDYWPGNFLSVSKCFKLRWSGFVNIVSLPGLSHALTYCWNKPKSSVELMFTFLKKINIEIAPFGLKTWNLLLSSFLGKLTLRQGRNWNSPDHWIQTDARTLICHDCFLCIAKFLPWYTNPQCYLVEKDRFEVWLPSLFPGNTHCLSDWLSAQWAMEPRTNPWSFSNTVSTCTASYQLTADTAWEVEEDEEQRKRSIEQREWQEIVRQGE